MASLESECAVEREQHRRADTKVVVEDEQLADRGQRKKLSEES
jgi:hypothetical protein